VNPRIITKYDPAAGALKVHVSLFPEMNGRQSNVAVVGSLPNLTYRSASPVPLLIEIVNVSLPAGTFITQNCCDPLAPEMLLTGMPSLSVAGPVVTAIDADAVRTVVPDVPVTEKVVVAAAAVVAAAIVSVALEPAVTVAGENDPVTPVGSPDTLSAIACVLPFTAVVVTEYDVELPAATDADAGDTAMVKSGGVCALIVIDTALE
jgi:hypothetical protein